MKRYSTNAFNRLYELAYYQDDIGVRENLIKWTSDLLISIDGDLWPLDSNRIASAIDQINNIGLPVTLSLTSNEEIANVKLCFGEKKDLIELLKLHNPQSFLGVGIVSPNFEETQSIKIGFSNNASKYNGLDSAQRNIVRTSIILEEITQSLGIVGDSWSIYESIFFEGHACRTKLSALDREVLKLLYEPFFEQGFSRSDYEQFFGTQLWHIDTEQKLRKILESSIDSCQVLESIAFLRKNSITQGKILKFPNLVFVDLVGNYRTGDQEFLESLTSQISEISPNLQLLLEEENFRNAYPRISVEFGEIDSSIEYCLSERWLNTSSMMYPVRLKGEVKITFDQESARDNQAIRNKLVYQGIFKMLGFDHLNIGSQNIDSLGFVKNGSSLLPIKYKEALQLLYNSNIPHGISSEVLDKLLPKNEEWEELCNGTN